MSSGLTDTKTCITSLRKAGWKEGRDNAGKKGHEGRKGIKEGSKEREEGHAERGVWLFKKNVVVGVV
jgi:hypothetical protein